MKSFAIFFGIFCVAATVIMLKLTLDGVSIRSAPIISPSPQGTEYKNVASSVVNRLFPDFQMADVVLIGSPTDLKSGPQIIDDLKSNYIKQFRKAVTLLADDGNLTEEMISQCEKPCWILTSDARANELSEYNAIPQILNSMKNVRHFHITLISFFGVPEPTPDCIAEKRLSLQCLIPLSIHEVRKKFKDPSVDYFFMRKYQDRDYFLFIQSSGK